jgi:hypothetical protein
MAFMKHRGAIATQSDEDCDEVREFIDGNISFSMS